MRYINRISRSNDIVYSTELKDYGVTVCQHPYIRHICAEPGISQEKLSKQLCLHPSSVARQLSALEKKGLITRVQDEEDRRAYRVYPTEKMKDLDPQVRRVMRSWNEYLLQDLSEEEKESLYEMLDKLLKRAIAAEEKTLGGK